MSHRPIATLALLAALAASVAGPSSAQTRPDPAQKPEPAPSTAPPEKIAPPADARESSGSTGAPVGRAGSDGVIKPPTDVDPGMTQPAPTTGPRSMPVIPPPGSHPDDPVKPK